MTSTSRTTSVGAIIVAVVVGHLVLAQTAATQEDGSSKMAAPKGEDAAVTPAEAQIELYAKAQESYGNGDYAEAIELLETSLKLGELNVTWLNLGRAYFKNGQCDEAEKAYDSALTAPRVAEPSREAVAAKIDEYRAELETCPGIVVAQCIPETLKLSVDGGPPQPCSEPLALSPGTHKILAYEGNLTTEIDLEVVSRQEYKITLEAEAPPAVKDTGALGTWGLITGGVGLAIVGIGAVVDVTVVGPAIDDYEAAVEAASPDEDSLRDDAESGQTTVLVMYAIGGTAIVAGGVMALLGLSGDETDPPAEGNLTPSPWLSPDGKAGIQLNYAW